jgi:hypothetical protein
MAAVALNYGLEAVVDMKAFDPPEIGLVVRHD